MAKQNCWEFKKCGRQPGGAKARELGVCIAATETKLHTVHGGRNGGRACWIISGTLCGGEVQGSYALKNHNCLQCDFYKVVKQEEASNMTLAGTLLKKLH